MEKKKEVKDTSKEYVRRIVTPIFNKVLQETTKNPLSVGSVRSKKNTSSIYYPHNYRLYIDFSKENLNIKKLSKLPKPTPIGSVVTTYRLKNSKEHEINNFMGCRLTIKKTQIEIQDKIEPEKKYLIKITTKAHKEVIPIIQAKNKKCLNVLKKFIKKYGGSSDYRILKIFAENKAWGTDRIDILELKSRWHRKLTKKVYNELPINVEFADPIAMSNHIENSAVESIAPTIANELAATREMIRGVLEINASTSKTLNQFVTQFLPIQADFTVNIKSHTKVIKEMAKGFKRFNKLLSVRQKRLGEFF